MTVHAHPLAAAKALKTVAFVLLLPVLRRVFQMLTDRAVTPLGVLEFVLLGVVLFFAAAFRYSCKIEWDGRKLRMFRGFLIRRTAVIDCEKIAAVTVIRSVPDRLFGASTVLFHTEAGFSHQADYSYTLSRKDAAYLVSELFGSETGKNRRATAEEWVLSAAAGSSAVTGWALAVPLIRRAGKLFGIALSRLLFTRISSTAVRFDAYFPAVLNTVTMLLIVGYAVSFLSSLLGLACFRLRFGRLTSVATGLFTRRKAVFRRSAVRAAIFTQTPFLRAIRRHSVRFSVGAVGRTRAERYLSVPIGRPSRQNQLCEKAFLPCNRPGIFLRPSQTRYTAWRFYRWPILWLAVVLTAAVIFGKLLVFFDRFAVFLTVPLLVAAAYYGHLCRFNLRVGGLTVGNRIAARNSHGFCMRELYCPRETVAGFRLFQTPRDRRENTCNVRIILNTKPGDTVTVRRLNARAVGERIKNFFR